MDWSVESIIFKKVVALVVLTIFLMGILGVFIFYGNLKRKEQKTNVDPRIYMAAERTFLAWVRTAISITVFGFVIEKFEFFLIKLGDILDLDNKVHHEKLFGIGAFIIIIGVITLILGTTNFYRTIGQVDSGFYRTNVWLYKLYGGIIFLTCLTLAFYILEII